MRYKNEVYLLLNHSQDPKSYKHIAMKNAVLTYPGKAKKELDKVNKTYKLNNLIFIGGIVVTTIIYILLFISLT
jgi:hypothetical protein